MDSTHARLQPSRGRVLAVTVIEGALLLVVLGTMAYAVLDYVGTGSLFSLWLAVMFSLLTFAPLIRRASGNHVLVLFGNVCVLLLTGVTAIALVRSLRRAPDFADGYMFALLFVMVFWIAVRERILTGRWN